MSEAATILDRHRRRRRSAGIVAAVSIAAAGVWAAWAGSTMWTDTATETGASEGSLAGTTAKNSAGSLSSAPPPTRDARANTAPFDESVFNARLWVAPPRPVEVVASKAPEPPPTPPPPFKLQLVGLQRGSTPDEVSAVVYDPTAFKVTRVARGASIGRYTLEDVDVIAGEAVFIDREYPGKPRHTLRLATLAAPKTPLKVVNAPQKDGGAP